MKGVAMRIAQEALNNLVKHTKATHVELGINSATALADVDRKPLSRVELRMSDGGRSFDPTNI